mmetsp:Transcript_22761/g.49108  ORF Transcript_22761/g.49108 Transcript_22761/m.49108 type:complete len:244 (+) Transcript_22761:851-1582(+)
MQLVLLADLERVLLPSHLGVADTQIAVERSPVDRGRQQLERLAQERACLLVLILSFKLLLPPLALHLLAHHALDLIEQFRQLLSLLVVRFALTVLGVELQGFAKVTQRELRVAHHIEALASLVQLAQRVICIECHLLLATLFLPLLSLLAQPRPLLCAHVPARELLVLAVRFTGANTASAFAIPRRPAFYTHIAAGVSLRLPFAGRAAICCLSPRDAHIIVSPFTRRASPACEGALLIDEAVG